MGMIGYKPPRMKAPQNPYAPVDPFASAPATIAPEMSPVAIAPAPKVKAPFDWERAAGILGDALAGLNGQQGSYAPMMARRLADQTAFERGEQQYQRRRNDEQVDWRARAEFERANPKAPQPTEFERLAATAYGQGSPEYLAAVRDYVGTRRDPIVNIPLPGGDMYLGPRSGMGGIPRQSFGPAIGTIRDGYRFRGGNPNDQNAWERMGGAAPQGAGDFQRS